MISFFSRREAILGAIAASFAVLWPKRSTRPGQTRTDDDPSHGAYPGPTAGDRGVVSVAYTYDATGRLLSTTTTVDPEGRTSWTF